MDRDWLLEARTYTYTSRGAIVDTAFIMSMSLLVHTVACYRIILVGFRALRIPVPVLGHGLGSKHVEFIHAMSDFSS